jgi:hypothetical protein
MTDLRGILTAMATPFTPDGAVDEAATRELARFLLENGSHGVVAAGTTGESTTLDDAEHIGVLRSVVDEVADRLRNRDQRHSPHDRADQGSGRRRRRRGAGRHPVLQQAEPGRGSGPL